MDGPGIPAVRPTAPICGGTVAIGRGDALAGCIGGPDGDCAVDAGGITTDDRKKTAAIAARRYPGIVDLHPKRTGVVALLIPSRWKRR